MADTAPSCKTYLSPGYTTSEIQSKKPSNPSFQPTIQQDTLHQASGMVCYPIYPQVTITRLSTKCPRCCFTSPPRSRQPTGLPACLPPDQRWSPHNNWFPARRTWLSYRATPRFQRGHSKVAGNLPCCLLPRAGLLAAALFLSVACMGSQVWEAKVGGLGPRLPR